VRKLNQIESRRARSLTELGVSLAVFTPTRTGLEKQLHDATAVVRTMLADEGLHDYDQQNNLTPMSTRVILVVNGGVTMATEAKFYRTARGDRRMRFSSIRALAEAGDAVAIVSWKSALWLLNLSAGHGSELGLPADDDFQWTLTTAPLRDSSEHARAEPDVPSRVPSGEADGESVILAHGFNPNAVERKVIERRAMELALSYLIALGYEVTDVGDTASYDIHAVRNGDVLWVEVKGTVSAGAKVILTKNEVHLHREVYPHNMLIIVSRIQLDRGGPTLTASGGILSLVSPWDIERKSLTPISYLYEVPPSELG
jgi:hypothetical protein